jgi:hypothetical protein
MSRLMIKIARMIKIVRSEVLAGLALITAGLAADPAVVSAQQRGKLRAR